MDSPLKTMNSNQVRQAYFNFSVDIALSLQYTGELASYSSEVFKMNKEGILEPPNKSDLSVNDIFLVRDYNDYNNPTKCQVVMIKSNNGKGESGSTEYTCSILSESSTNLYEETDQQLTLIPLKLSKTFEKKIPTAGKSLVAKLNLSDSKVMNKLKFQKAFFVQKNRSWGSLNDLEMALPIVEWVNSLNGCGHWPLEQRAKLIGIFKSHQINTLEDLMKKEQSNKQAIVNKLLEIDIDRMNKEILSRVLNAYISYGGAKTKEIIRRTRRARTRRKTQRRKTQRRKTNKTRKNKKIKSRRSRRSRRSRS